MFLLFFINMLEQNNNHCPNIINWKITRGGGWPQTAQPSSLGQQQAAWPRPQRSKLPTRSKYPTDGKKRTLRTASPLVHDLFFIKLDLKSTWMHCSDDNRNGNVRLLLCKPRALQPHAETQCFTPLQQHCLPLNNVIKIIIMNLRGTSPLREPASPYCDSLLNTASATTVFYFIFWEEDSRVFK